MMNIVINLLFFLLMAMVVGPVILIKIKEKVEIEIIKRKRDGEQ